MLHARIKSYDSIDVFCQRSSVSSLFHSIFPLSRFNLGDQIMISFLKGKKKVSSNYFSGLPLMSYFQ